MSELLSGNSEVVIVLAFPKTMRLRAGEVIPVSMGRGMLMMSYRAFKRFGRIGVMHDGWTMPSLEADCVSW